METKKSEAAEKKRSNKYNCAQAITCTYCQNVGIDEQTAFDLGAPFGAGMGNMEGTCGALIGAGIILGLKNKDKVKSLTGMKQIITKFQERNNATQCKLLKGKETQKVLRECPDCVADACEFLEEIINE